MPRSDDVEDGQSINLYSLWNVKLLEAFFSPASKGDEVWLQVDPNELDSIGPELGGDEGFLRCVRRGPPWGTIGRKGLFITGAPSDLVQRVVGLVQQRKHVDKRPASYRDPGRYSPVYQSSNAPTYLPYLAALVRSASSEEGGFYDDIRQALQLGPNWGPPKMEALEVAWKDLEAWTEATAGEFGRFVFRKLGGLARVGVPRSQSIMRKRDCELIPRVFAQLSARPGQQTTSRLIDDVASRAAVSLFLTRGFRDALSNPAFKEPISARLSALFEEWDGTVPTIGARDGGEDCDADAAANGEALEVCVSLQEGNLFPWKLRWRVPAFVDGGEVTLRREGAEWVAHVRGTEPTSTSNDGSAELQAAARSALSESASDDVPFSARLMEDGGEQVDLAQVFLRKAILRVFIWGYNHFKMQEELHEHDLPLNGPAFLLASACNAQRLCKWLERESIQHQHMDTSGLPERWILVCVLDCSTLTESQRNEIPDGEMDRNQRRVIRLVGGRSVSRAGIKQYMSYDLPVVELDAPAGTVVKASGLLLEEERMGGNPHYLSGVRRFQVTPENRGPKLFRIEALQDGKSLGTTTMRVATDSGEQVESGGAFSLDSQGNPRRDDSGLRGVLWQAPADVAMNMEPSFSVPLGELGSQLQRPDADHTTSSPAALFLDTLAHIGSIAYGPARDQLGRLLAKTGSRTSPRNVLFDLRSRGHLEIEINAKGHMARVYSVQPSLYELPAKCSDLRVFGVLGTLPLQLWRSLATPIDDWCIYHSPASAGFLDTWRIVARDQCEIELIAKASGLAVVRRPSGAITAWAASKEDVRAQIERLARESIGQGVRGLERLKPTTGLFFPLETGSFESQGPVCQFFRMEDRDTGKLQVYTLGIDQGGTGARFGFSRDSRWGVWLALGAFADYVKKQYNIGDASPWPISYVRETGTLLLPARVSLPVVLERALVLCSGSAPEPMDLLARSDAGSPHIVLVRKANQIAVAWISKVYGEMAEGKWLAYKRVPQEIASLVAGKVGATLMDG